LDGFKKIFHWLFFGNTTKESMDFLPLDSLFEIVIVILRQVCYTLK